MSKKTLAALLGDLSPAQAACRDYRHNWELALVFHSKLMGATLGRRLLCTRCGTAKTDYINRNTGEVLARVYNYSAGYQIKGRGEYRAHEITRQIRVNLLAAARIEEIEDDA